MIIRIAWRAWVAAFLSLAAVAQSSTANGRQFPIGSWSRLDELPAGRLRTRLGQLPPTAQRQALGWLRSFHFTDQDLRSLRTDPDGGIYYADPAADATTAQPADDPPVTAAASVPVNPFPTGLIFHSRPGSPNVLFLNFSGETVTGTLWNSTLGRTTISAVAFSTDADAATFSDAEQLAIRRIWERVSEDYAPFDIDVTTERPATFGNRTAEALITRTKDASGAANPDSASGGVAYVNVFGTSTYAKYRPAWIYFDNLASAESNIGEAAAHEVGHNLGLSHDGTTDGADYYAGHGSGETSWGPIMGTGYGRNVSQWSKGEYYHANNQQDDLAIIAGKLSYRVDDHGDTPGTATALVVTNGTDIVATTPATDPTNADPVNKGVIERGTDVDMFSFVTGDGPVSLTVAPWVVPSGTTRGGDLDVRLELRDGAGALLLVSDPPDQTSAQIVTNLAQGRYYLSVQDAGTGSPLAAVPTGYTSYGSIGQYFVSGHVTAAVGFVAPPVAEIQVAGISASGQGADLFTVTYTDNVAIKTATLDGNDLRITGPNGYDRQARLVSVDITGDGTPRVATYAADPSVGAVWRPADNGAYSVSVVAGQVGDTEGAFVAPGQLGQFTVTVPVSFYTATMDADPGWTLEPQWQFGSPSYGSSGPAAGFTGSKIIGYNLSGNYANRLAVKYATTPPINAAGSTALTLHFHRWLRVRSGDTATIDASTDGASWTRLWTSSRNVQDSSWVDVQYPLLAGFAGSPSVRLRWGLASNNTQADIGWNLDDVELLGDGTLDTDPPVASLSVSDVVIGGSPSQSCSVTFTDQTAVSLASLDSADLVVTGPNGFAGTVEFTGADLPSDGSPCTATYAILAPDGTWDAADDGTYELTLVDGEVEDIFHNAAPQAVLGSFKVAIPPETVGDIRLTGALTPDGFVLNWNTMAGQSYSVWSGTGSSANLAPLPGATGLPSTAHSFTNAVDPAASGRFFQVRLVTP